MRRFPALQNRLCRCRQPDHRLCLLLYRAEQPGQSRSGCNRPALCAPPGSVRSSSHASPVSCRVRSPRPAGDLVTASDLCIPSSQHDKSTNRASHFSRRLGPGNQQLANTTAELPGASGVQQNARENAAGTFRTKPLPFNTVFCQGVEGDRQELLRYTAIPGRHQFIPVQRHQGSASAAGTKRRNRAPVRWAKRRAAWQQALAACSGNPPATPGPGSRPCARWRAAATAGGPHSGRRRSAVGIRARQRWSRYGIAWGKQRDAAVVGEENCSTALRCRRGQESCCQGTRCPRLFPSRPSSCGSSPSLRASSQRRMPSPGAPGSASSISSRATARSLSWPSISCRPLAENMVVSQELAGKQRREELESVAQALVCHAQTVASGRVAGQRLLRELPHLPAIRN